MELNTFIRLYQEFLCESERHGWEIEILVEEFGNHLTSIKNKEGIEVQFFIELDLENCVKLNETKNQGKLNYGVIRSEGKGDIFAKEVLESFHQFWARRSPKRKIFILYKPS